MSRVGGISLGLTRSEGGNGRQDRMLLLEGWMWMYLDAVLCRASCC